jgi:hypothetical protein
MKMNALFLIPTALFFIGNPASFASSEHDAYTKLFPFHVEYCSLSQMKPLVGASGGPGGHAIVFVQGLCKDPSVAYPKVKPCSEIDASARGDGGVGISVDSEYRNINWNAYPGYDLFSNGYGYSDDKVVNQAAIDKMVDEVVAKKVFQGVKFNPDVLNSHAAFSDSVDYQKEVALSTLGTDYAIQYARDMKCIRFPVAEAKLEDAATFLNNTNAPYLGIEAQYKANPETYAWSGIENNCAHLSANLLENMGVRKGIPISRPLVDQVFHLAIPRNGLATLQEQMHYGSVSFDALFKNEMHWGDIHDHQWAPIGYGAITKVFPIFKSNQFFQTEKLKGLELLPEPANMKSLAFVPKWIAEGLKILIDSRKALTNPDFTELKANAIYWQTEYSDALKEIAGEEETPELKIYSAYIQAELNKISSDFPELKQLN